MRMNASSIIRIESLHDPRVAAYRDLRDRTLRGERMFVAEGRLLVTRLLESRFATESLLLAESYADEFLPRVPPGVPIYVAREELLRAIIGFPLHQGVLAAGCRRPEMPLQALLGPPADRPLAIIVCPQITKPENMGLIFRVAAGLGADGIVLGPQCCDPFSRRCLRVSIGAVLSAPYRKSTDLAADLAALHDRWGVEFLAAVLDERAVPLAEVRWPRRAGLMLGNEFDGLSGRWLEFCTQRATIPMARQTDSLNLGVAAGIFVYEMMRERLQGGSNDGNAMTE
jgi:tRNA G18 (ribose-2'-O)-methylase SpoU